MVNGAYNYDPEKIKEYGKDRMRFELGDTMTDGGSDTAALTDAEIQAAIGLYPQAWKRAKLMLLESLCRRFAYEVDTKTGPLDLALSDRAKLWQKDYEALKKEVELETSGAPKFGSGIGYKPPYFHTGMQENIRARGGLL